MPAFFAEEMLVGMNRRRTDDSPDENGSLAIRLGRIIGDGEMADRVRAHDWSSTPLGPVDGWSNELLLIVNLTLASPTPTRTMWGPEFILIYNDAYRRIPGPRHPAALGQPARAVYQESWPVVGPLIETAYATGQTFFHEKLLVPLPTVDGIQNFYLNYSFTPIFDNGAITGLFGPLYDVTGEVTAERNLRESEARTSRILDSIGDAVIVTDAEAMVTGMNPVAEALTGWTLAEAREAPLTTVFRIINESTRQPVEGPAEKVRRTRSVAGLANYTILVAKDGRETPIDDSGAPIFGEDGQLAGIVLVFRNINERRAAEREKDRVTGQLGQFLEVTSDAIVGVNRDWKLAYLNSRARQIYAADRDLIGCNLWKAFPAAVYDGSPYQYHYRRAMDEGIAGVFEAHYAEPLNLSLYIEVYPTQGGIVTFSRDVTEEVAARKALRDKSEQAERQRIEIESVYKTAPIGLALFDTTDFRYLRLNDRQAEFFGLTPEQIVGRTLTEMAPIEGLRELFEQVLAGEPVVNYPLEGELITRPGEHRYWTVSYYPVLGADGSVQAITAASLEITQQKKAEKALIQSEKLAVVGRLATSIAHEINNPLESITNLLYLAAASEEMPQIKGYLEVANRELRRVSAITTQTLRFHKQASSPREVTPGELIDSVVLLYQSRILNAGVQIEERDRGRSLIRCFEGEIRQVLSNLLGNALDAMPYGGGRLLLRSRTACHWPSGRHGMIFTVADTGGGMPKPVQERLFEPFYTTKGIGGSGLGLWVSKEITDRHHGVLRVRSSQREGKSGTVFTLFLPFDAVSR